MKTVIVFLAFVGCAVAQYFPPSGGSSGTVTLGGQVTGASNANTIAAIDGGVVAAAQVCPGAGSSGSTFTCATGQGDFMGQTGYTIVFLPNSNCNLNATLNVDAHGAAGIYQPGGLVAVSNADCLAGGSYTLVYDPNGFWEMQAPPAASLGLGAAAKLGVPIGAASGGTGVTNNSANTVTFSGHYSLGITLSANTSLTFPTSGTLATTAGNVATATNLATYPTPCSGGQFSTGYTTGTPPTNNCGTPAGGGNVSNTGTPVNHQIGIWASATTIGGESTATIDSSGNETINSLLTSTLKDANGNPFILSTATSSAVDSVTVTNAATANPATVTIGATGSDSNINLSLAAKGTGTVSSTGSFSTTADGVHAGGLSSAANTSLFTTSANYFSWWAPNSATCTWATSVGCGLQFSATAPTASNVLLVGAPDGTTGIAQVTYGVIGTAAAAATAAACTGNNWSQGWTTGSNNCAQPAYSNISGRPWECQTGMGDGLNAFTSGTYLQSFCKNDTGSTVTITAASCFTDGGTPTVNFTKYNAGSHTAILTGAITCTTTFAAGALSGTPILASGDWLEFTFVSGSTATQTTWTVSGSY